MIDGDAAVRAAQQYRRRLMRQERPSGEIDVQGVWRPSAKEWSTCCMPLEIAAGNYILHCCSSRHVATLHGVSTVVLWQAYLLLEDNFLPEVVSHTMVAIAAQERLSGWTVHSWSDLVAMAKAAERMEIA